MATIQSSRRLAHFSTIRNVDRLICCVRDGYRSYPAAMAAILLLQRGLFYKDKIKSCIEMLHTGFRLDLVW